jgi:hypothetical protein
MARLELEPPRTYTLRDCYHRRVWRSGGEAVAADGVVAGFALAALGLLHGDDFILYGGLVLAGVAATIGALEGLRVNRGRLALIRGGPTVEGVLERPRRVFTLREMFRPKKDRTFIIPYRYTDPSGTQRTGRAWVCGCVLDRLPAGSTERVAIDPERPDRSLILRLAVMVAPH